MTRLLLSLDQSPFVGLFTVCPGASNASATPEGPPFRGSLVWFQESLTIHLAAHARAIGLARMGLPDEQMQARFQSRLPPSEPF